MLSGLAFTSSFAIFGIFGGVVSDKVNRKWLIVLLCICWSASTFLSGFINNFYVFAILRFVLGLFEAFFNPAAYSIISDYFHP